MTLAVTNIQRAGLRRPACGAGQCGGRRGMTLQICSDIIALDTTFGSGSGHLGQSNTCQTRCRPGGGGGAQDAFGSCRKSNRRCQRSACRFCRLRCCEVRGCGGNANRAGANSHSGRIDIGHHIAHWYLVTRGGQQVMQCSGCRGFYFHRGLVGFNVEQGRPFRHAVAFGDVPDS